MLSGEDLAAEIQVLLSEKLLIAVQSPATDLLEGGILDSLTLVQLLVHLEEHFGFKMALEDIEIDDLRSINSIARLVAARMHACAAD